MFEQLFEKMLDPGILEELKWNKDSKEYQWFIQRTNRHINLVKEAAKKIVEVYPEFEELLQQVEVHDASKFEEPELTPYISITWRHKIENEKGEYDPIQSKGYQTPGLLSKEDENEATLHHITTNLHHPEYWLKDKSLANLSAECRDKSDFCVDASRMSYLAIAEMVADWQAMSEELKKNTTREWFDKQKDVRWHFSKEQESFIDNMLKVFEQKETKESINKEYSPDKSILKTKLGRYLHRMKYKEVPALVDEEMFDKIRTAWKKLRSPLGYVCYDDVAKELSMPVGRLMQYLKGMHQQNLYSVRFNVNRLGDNVYFKLPNERERREGGEPQEEETKESKSEETKNSMFEQLFEKINIASKIDEEVGRISPFGSEVEEIQAVLAGKKTVAMILSISDLARQSLKNPNLKSVKIGKSYTIFYRPEDEADALSRADEIDNIKLDVDDLGYATREQMIRLGELFDYSKADIDVFLKKVGYPGLTLTPFRTKERDMFEQLLEQIEATELVDKILEKYKRVETDGIVITTTGGEISPVATLADEYGGRAQIGIDDGCYVLFLIQDDGTYKRTAWIFPEAHEVLKDLPDPKEAQKKRDIKKV